MKKLLLTVFALILLESCSKTESQPAAATDTESTLAQEPLKLKNAAGEEISVTYYSEGDYVAVKIKKAGEAEQKLLAKTVNANGNPIFTNDNYMWEITREAQAGKLSEKSGNAVEYSTD